MRAKIGKFKEHEDLHEIINCAILSAAGSSNRDIAEKLGLSDVNVTRNLQDAYSLGILVNELNLPPEGEAMKRLMDEYKEKGLREAHVFQIPNIEEEQIDIMLASLGAEYLEIKLDVEKEQELLFEAKLEYRVDLKSRKIPEGLREDFNQAQFTLSKKARVFIDKKNNRWFITDKNKTYAIEEGRGRSKKLRIYKRAGCVAIGPGRTTLEFIKALSDEKRPEMVVGSTTSATKIETFMASDVIIGIAAGKWECQFGRFELYNEKASDEERMKYAREYADIFIFGIDDVLDINGVTALALISESINLDEATLETELARLRGEGVVGFINYQPICEDGSSFQWDMENYKKIMYPTVLRLNTIKEIAKDNDKNVICIAGGKSKVNAIRAALTGGYFNTLITDYDTAMAFLG